MAKISREKLDKILEKHKHWLYSDCDGWEQTCVVPVGYRGIDVCAEFFEEFCTRCAKFEECKHIVPCENFEENE